MTKITLNQEQLERYARELDDLRKEEPASIMLPPLCAIAIISHIQLASRHPSCQGQEFTEMAIDTARQLQGLFDSDSEVYRVLEIGWDPECDLPVASDRFCETPCEDFRANRRCRCTGYKVAEVLHNDSCSDVLPEVLAHAVAMMQQLKSSLEQYGFEVADIDDDRRSAVGHRSKPKRKGRGFGGGNSPPRP